MPLLARMVNSPSRASPWFRVGVTVTWIFWPASPLFGVTTNQPAVLVISQGASTLMVNVCGVSAE